MKLTQKLKFKGHSHFIKPHHYSHRDWHPQNRGNGYLDMLIWSPWPKKLIKKGQKVTKTIIKKMGQCTHINSNHVHNCVKHIRNGVHDSFSN